MLKEKGSLLNFKLFLALIILIPATLLLLQYLDELSVACESAKNTVILAVIVGCMVVLSLIAFLKELMVME